MNTGRSALGGGGTQTAAWAAAGYISDYTDKTEEYNGSGWATSGDTNTPRSELGAGNYASPQTAAIIFGGKTPPAPGTARDDTETYDGSTWTEVGDLQAARRSNLDGAGTTTACVAFGGGNPAPARAGTPLE